eukprot:TRINITY_DN10584_c0_g1_i1.p1 TRINITY_DN10584_c0_g1~~TRINITY_DN10584_c0_g1_i1.p1  ORF type:complete len:443 (+),score=62.40 TRINITY_DN10584_c0_g1_i1:86-1330(+)
MCFPPYCHPATHVLGCFGLRQGAIGVLVMNAAYGLCLVVVHALLMGEFNKVEVGGPEGGPAAVAGEGEKVAKGENDFGSEASERRLAHNDGVGWLIQIMDLDIGWGHELMGFDDYSNMLAGRSPMVGGQTAWQELRTSLVGSSTSRRRKLRHRAGRSRSTWASTTMTRVSLSYGIVVIVACGYMLHSIQTGGGSLGLPTMTRWFVAFMNLELMLYIGVVLVKLPQLCKMQTEYMPNLHMECPVQRFMYLQRTLFLIVLASLCIWIFSSYSFTLTFGVHGPNVMDRPEFQDHIDIRDSQLTGKPPPGYGGPPGAPPHSLGGSPPYQTRHSLAAGGRSLVGGAVQASSFHSVRSQALGPAPSAGSQSLGPAPSAGPQRTSYNIGSMARAGSSMVSSASERSHPETYPLIKPPLHVY